VRNEGEGKGKGRGREGKGKGEHKEVPIFYEAVVGRRSGGR